jgi:hypothetical protein
VASRSRKVGLSGYDLAWPMWRTALVARNLFSPVDVDPDDVAAWQAAQAAAWKLIAKDLRSPTWQDSPFADSDRRDTLAR